ERGKNLLSRRRVKPALDTFDKAIEGFVANHRALEQTSELEEAYLRKGAALFLMGREDEAAKGPVLDALLLHPALQLDESDGYGAPYVALVEKVRETLPARG